jgi:hypothetical protein
MKTIYLQELLKDVLYNSSNVRDQILFETYTLIGENINTDNAYEYTAEGKTIWSFVDKEGYKHVIKINYNPGVEDKTLTVKLFWDDNGKPNYTKPPVTDEKIFNTYLKILIEKILPQLPNLFDHTKTDKLTLDATDAIRYRLYSIALSSLLDSSKYDLIKEPKLNTLYIKIK